MITPDVAHRVLPKGNSRIHIQRPGFANNISALHLVFCIASIGLCLAAPGRPSTSFLWTCLATSLLQTTAHYIHLARHRSAINWLRADVAFAPGYFLVHFGYVFYGLCGWIGSNWMHIPGRHSLNLAAATCSAGLAAFYVGFTYLPEHGRQQRAPETHNREAIRTHGMAASRAGHLCLLMSAPILIWAVFAFRDVFLDGSYSGWKGVSVFESGIVWGARMLLAAGSVLVVLGRRLEGRSTPLSLVAGIVCIVFFLIHLVCGDRSEIIYYLGPAVVAFSTYWRRFRFWHIATCVTVSLALFGIMVMARTADERSLNTVAITAQDGWKESVDKSIRGFSASGHVLFAAIDYVPAKHDFYYGRMQLGGIMQFIPYAKTLTGLRARDCSSASLLTFIILGENASMGIGTTVVADFYLDMGWPGAVLGLGIFGWFCKYAHCKSRENPLSIFWAIANSCLVAGCSIVSRYSAISLIARKTIYVAFFGVAAFRVMRAHSKGASRLAMAHQFR